MILELWSFLGCVWGVLFYLIIYHPLILSFLPIVLSRCFIIRSRVVKACSCVRRSVDTFGYSLWPTRWLPAITLLYNQKWPTHAHVARPFLPAPVFATARKSIGFFIRTTTPASENKTFFCACEFLHLASSKILSSFSFFTLLLC